MADKEAQAEVLVGLKLDDKHGFQKQPGFKVDEIVGEISVQVVKCHSSRDKTPKERVVMIMPNGKVAGTTNGKGSAAVKFCIGCHAAVAESQDAMFFLPEEFRKN